MLEAEKQIEYCISYIPQHVEAIISCVKIGAKAPSFQEWNLLPYKGHTHCFLRKSGSLIEYRGIKHNPFNVFNDTAVPYAIELFKHFRHLPDHEVRLNRSLVGVSYSNPSVNRCARIHLDKIQHVIQKPKTDFDLSYCGYHKRKN